jgi:hypothetical protein
MHNLEPKPSFGYINLETTVMGMDGSLCIWKRKEINGIT